MSAAAPGGWRLAWALALAWGLGPALPALARGELLGQPYTDLYPAVWGLWWFAEQQPGLPTHCAQLAWPGGMDFYYASPLRGWLAWPLVAAAGVPAAWNLLTVAARVATVLAAFGAARAWGLGAAGALTAAAVYGASPFFQGYAVEGIVEGTDGWALAGWLWLEGWRRAAPRGPRGVALAAAGFALAVTSSWYQAACACLLAAAMGPRAWAGAAGGLALAAPGLWAFLGAFPAREALDPAVRASMGTALLPSPPGALPGLNPFARTSWVGLVAPLLALGAARRRPAVAATLAVIWLLSLGRGPIYELPPFSSLRFPYRLHAATLACLALLAGETADALAARRRAFALLGPLIAVEGLLLSPVEPLLPGAPAEVPAIYREIPPGGGAVLDLPGPLAMPPGAINRSRPRARWFLYAQTAHGRPSPWRPDFNSVGVAAADDGLDGARALDPLARRPAPEVLSLPATVDAVVVHRGELRGNADDAARLLDAAGWVRIAEDGERWLYTRGDGE
jgi:hypothetical protein